MNLKPPTSKVELRIKCHKILDKDTLSKSDPRVSVYEKDRAGLFRLIGKTETIQNQLSPEFKTPIVIDYRFEEIQVLKFEIHDVDKNDEDFIGDASCTLTSILSKPGQTVCLQLLTKSGKHAGSMTVIAEEIKNTLQTIKFNLIGKKFDKKDLFGAGCDPYLIISRKVPSTNTFVKIYESQVQKGTLNPVFSGIEMKLEELCGGDMQREIKFEFYDWDRIGKHDYIGEFHTNAQELLQPNQAFNVINSHKQEKKSGYKNSGTVSVSDAVIEREYNFLEYIMGGCQMNLIVGIDCTASNGDSNDPNSLHYKNAQGLNQYANAICSVGNVIVPYTTTPLIPVYGFGGIMPGQSEVSHCFPMTLNASNTLCCGVNGVLDCYYDNISKIQLHGPTYFAPLINMAARYASQGQSQSNQKYTILMIITDGEILDADNTIDAIVKSSGLPLSIIIVGVGNANFTNMNILDGDDAALQSGGVRAERDIVQFVAMRDYLNRPNELAAEVLREIPTQFLSFMKKYKFRPNPPPPPPPVIIGAPPQYDNPTITTTTTTSPSTGIDLNKGSNVGLNLTKTESSPSPSGGAGIDLNKGSVVDITKGVSNVSLEKN
ncbi:hypothetical protein ACTFIR_008887 [Dictyostelium discoideum]